MVEHVPTCGEFLSHAQIIARVLVQIGGGRFSFCTVHAVACSCVRCMHFFLEIKFDRSGITRARTRTRSAGCAEKKRRSEKVTNNGWRLTSLVGPCGELSPFTVC